MCKSCIAAVFNFIPIPGTVPTVLYGTAGYLTARTCKLKRHVSCFSNRNAALLALLQIFWMYPICVASVPTMLFDSEDFSFLENGCGEAESHWLGEEGV